MSLVINYNAASQLAQNNLQQTQSQLNQAIERLSSGRKINSAADDAAGLAIANRLTAQINGLDQAAQNAGDGISLAQTTEGALDQINNNLQRIRELSVQAANGTNSQSNLNSVQDEINARLDEIDRVAGQTAFNGINLLDGSTDKVNIQVGYKDGQDITIDLQEVSSDTLGLGSYNINGYDTSLSNASAATTASAVNADIFLTSGGTTFNALSAGTANLDITTQAGSTLSSIGGTTLSAGNIQVDDSGDLFVQAGSTTYAVTAVTSVSGDTTTTSVSLTVNTTADLGQKTDGPLATMDSALGTISEFRSDLGAVQNRFDSAISTINSTETNLEAAKSRIVNTNYAEAVSQLSQAKILNQAGTSVLAQANQTQSSVLSLLRNA